MTGQTAGGDRGPDLRRVAPDQRHRTPVGRVLRVAVLDQRFGVVFDVTGELISQIVCFIARQPADLCEHAIAILVSVHSLTLF